MPSDADDNSESESKPETEKDEQSIPTNKDTSTKRRTKTGCLTCRRRRIKCGEERPICKNCVKSRRDCAGYNPPLIYKLHGQRPSYPIPGTAVSNGSQWSYEQPSVSYYGIGNAVDYESHKETLPQGLHGGYGPTNPRQHVIVDSSSGNTWRGQHIENTLPPWHQHRQIYNIDSHDDARRSNYATNPAASTPQQLGTASDGSYMSAAANHFNHLGIASHGSSGNKDNHFENGSDHANCKSFISTHDEDADDPWDIDSDGVQDVDQERRERHPYDQSNTTIIGTNFVAPMQNAISNRYRASRSPLMEEKSKDIFRHFLSVTGPCMGTFDRHDTSHDLSMPKMIWNQGLPSMAFRSAALAHSILAVGAIHMAKLDLGSENTAMKHFTCALRRVGHALASPVERHKVPTLATVLVLGYYEVMSGDHSRWALHLSGARKLVMEHDYAGFIRSIKRLRARQSAGKDQVLPASPAGSDNHLLALLGDKDWNVDEGLISQLMGFEVCYDTQVQTDLEHNSLVANLNVETMADWKILMELYWWYCRQDIFMSMLSGDPLMLPFSQWRFCPPRGPIDDHLHPNATSDHLWLILARLTDFGGKDRERKQQLVNTQGGQWIPPPGFLEVPSRGMRGKQEQPMTGESNKSARPSANEGRTRTARPNSNSGPPQPMFYGMLPPAQGPVYMSDSFKFMDTELRAGRAASPTNPDSPQEHDLNAQLRVSLERFASISEVFDIFESRLGHDFQPVSSGEVQITTPFGPALVYRTPTIAAMWTFLLTGRILLRRQHPHSPPSAVISAAVNAQHTHEFAQKIGRICGGLYAQHAYLLKAGYVNRLLSAAIIETTLSLLFAAVQYYDPVQRAWTIGKLNEISQYTGWQSAAAVAAACEATWEKAGQAGKGPIYQRHVDVNNHDVRLNGRWKASDKDPHVPLHPTPAQEHESRFVSHDRNLVNRHASTRAHWAFGLLSAEEDLQRMSLNDQS